MNSVQLIGRITKDVELKQTTSGIPVASFSVAINYRNKDKKEYAEFIDCVIWQDLAEKLAPYLKKGKLVGISGSLHKRSYEDKQNANIKHYITEVNVSRLEFLDKKADSEQPPLPDVPPTEYGNATDDEPPISEDGTPF